MFCVGKVIVIASGKGGTGKSTTTAALACALSKMGKYVVCIDADSELRNLDLCLGLSDAAVLDYGDVLSGNTTLENALISCEAYPTLRFLAAPVSPIDGALEKLLPALKEKFDYALIDCPGGLGTVVHEAAKLSDMAIVVANADVCSHRDAARTAQIFASLGLPSKLLVNRVSNGFLRKTAGTLDDTIDYVGLRLIGYIPEDKAVSLSLAAGKPLLSYSSRGAAAAYMRVARRLNGENVPLRRQRI